MSTCWLLWTCVAAIKIKTKTIYWNNPKTHSEPHICSRIFGVVLVAIRALTVRGLILFSTISSLTQNQHLRATGELLQRRFNGVQCQKKQKNKKSTKIFSNLTYVCVVGGALDVQMYHQNYASYNDEFFYYSSTLVECKCFLTCPSCPTCTWWIWKFP